MKWKMISHSEFQMDESGYHVDLVVEKKSPPIWHILKDGLAVDHAYYHSPVTSDFNKELAAKAQIERILNELVKGEVGSLQMDTATASTIAIDSFGE